MTRKKYTRKAPETHFPLIYKGKFPRHQKKKKKLPARPKKNPGYGTDWSVK